MGILLDHWSSRTVLAVGTAIMGVSQVVMATTELLPIIELSDWHVHVRRRSLVRDGSGGVPRHPRRPAGRRAGPLGRATARDAASLAAVARHPATTLGFWIHLTGGFAANTFVMMWGIPVLVVAQGLSDGVASAIILTAVIGGVFGPVIGWLTSRHPLRRGTLALLVIWANFVCWTAVLS